MVSKSLKIGIIAMLFTLSLFVVGADAHAATHVSHRAGRSQIKDSWCPPTQVGFDGRGTVVIETGCGSITKVYGASASAGGFASMRVTLWAYYGGQYHIVSSTQTNQCCDVSTPAPSMISCGWIYHAQLEIYQQWWAPPWYDSINTFALNFC
jgi:hypothetical protein